MMPGLTGVHPGLTDLQDREEASPAKTRRCLRCVFLVENSCVSDISPCLFPDLVLELLSYVVGRMDLPLKRAHWLATDSKLDERW